MPQPRLAEDVRVALLPINADGDAEEWLPLVQSALRRTQQRLFILFTGAAASQPPCEALLRLAAAALEAAASEGRPCLDIVPLCPSAGWDALAAGKAPGRRQAEVLQSLQVVFAGAASTADLSGGGGGSRGGAPAPGSGSANAAPGSAAAADSGSGSASASSSRGPRRFGRGLGGPAQQQQQQQLPPEPLISDIGGAVALADALSAGRPADARPIAIAALEPIQSEGGAAPNLGGSTQRQQWGHVAVGGTFDRLHAGHRILLAAAALAATDTVYIGVTGPQLLKNKKHAELLQPYSRREAAAREYVQRVRPGVHVRTAELHDAKGLAAEVEAIQALVVSLETAGGAEAINEDRQARGFPPLEVLSVELVGAAGGTAAKLSSTELRAREAQAGDNRVQAPTRPADAVADW